MSEFDWPWQYNFPPFFTLQPNLDTRKKQLAMWCELILAFYKHNKLFTMDVHECHTSPLFYNKKINRRLSQDGIYTVLEELHKRGNMEWSDKSQKHCLLMWRTPEEWGKLVYQWVKNKGILNSVCTLYELASGEDTVGEEFHGLEDWLLKRAIQTLEKQRKAELMAFGESEGVKFF